MEPPHVGSYKEWLFFDGLGAVPTTGCDRTVTLWNMCFNYDVPGNIH